MTQSTPVQVELSGDRFNVIYRIAGDEAAARRAAEEITVEQTVEFPADLLPPGDISDQIVGHIEAISPAGIASYLVTISYPVEITGPELTQFLNVVMGNSSLKPGIRVERLALPDPLLDVFHGPRFGQPGLRNYLNVPERPLLCTALKPMGLPPEEIARLAHCFALGGIDIIKDDHGLADQPFCPFNERVPRAAEAVARANARTGGQAIYMPNITGPLGQLQENAYRAKEWGAGGLLIAPGLVGLDAIRLLAEDEALGLPLMSHPALLGSYVVNGDSGLSHAVLFGQLMRLAGADAVVYPNFGGRFSFSQAECREIVDGSTAPMGHLKPIFPTPGGGMSLDGLDEMAALYGRDVIYLIGGNLHRHGDDLVASARKFRHLVE